MKKLFLVVALGILLTSAYSQSSEQLILRSLSKGEAKQAREIFRGGLQVLIFSSSSCPFDKYYTERIQQLSREFSQVKFTVVYTDEDFSENAAVIQERSVTFGENVNVWISQGRNIHGAFSSNKSMHVLVFDWRGNSPDIKYNGAIDDNPQSSEAVKQDYLRMALEEILQGKNASQAESRVIGCVIH